MPTTTIVHVPESERLRLGKGSGAHSKFCFALHLAGTTIMQPGVQQTFHLGRSSSFLSFGTIALGGGRAARPVAMGLYSATATRKKVLGYFSIFGHLSCIPFVCVTRKVQGMVKQSVVEKLSCFV